MRPRRAKGDDRSTATVDAEQAEDGFKMSLDRARRHLKRARQLSVRTTGTRQLQCHLGLTLGETYVPKGRDLRRFVAQSPHQQHGRSHVARVHNMAPAIAANRHIVACRRRSAIDSSCNQISDNSGHTLASFELG